MKTELKDRILWYDGTNEVDADLVPYLITLGVPLSKIIVPSPSDDTLLFNSLSDDVIKFIKEENDPLDFNWNIPEEFLSMNLEEFIQERLQEFFMNKKIDKKSQEEYSERVSAELIQVKNRELEKLFKTLVFAVHEFKRTSTVWGVGRGSSCASFLLYLMEIHKIDPVKYNIPFKEFFHD